MENDEIARQLDEIADLLELGGGNDFRVRSYRNAARTVKDYPSRLAELIADGEDLTELPSVGDSIAADIDALVAEGHCERLDRLREETPGGLPEVMHIRGLGPRKARALYDALGIDGLDELRDACERGAVRELEGFGEKTEQNILRAIASRTADANRFPLKAAAEYAESLGRYLDGLASIDRWQFAGSFRRRKETVGDLDVIVHAEDRDAAAADLVAYERIARVESRGHEKTTIVLEGGLRVDFRFFEPERFGAALLYFTGSKAHNVALRRRAKGRGWKLNEYGILKGERVLAARDEEAIYHRLNLDWVPPELREDRGEIDASLAHALPVLIETRDIRGDLHCHTKETDGVDTLRDMVRAARDRGYEYLAVTDHSAAVSVTRGMDEKRIRRHASRIRKTNAALEGFRVLAGIEVDILEDGTLDLDRHTLGELDWVVASVHSYFELPEEAQTRRLVKAVESGVVHCLGHPLCRLIGRREPIRIDAETVFAACARHGVLLEINANPERLDLPDTYCKLAAELGAGCVISSDAHRRSDLDFMRYGVDVARRGWLGPREVANTGSVDELLAVRGGQARRKAGLRE